jgi:hypothetical protein
VGKVRENLLKHLSISANQPADHESKREMKRTLIILAMAGSALAGYYGREAQDVFDRSVKAPIGPYQATVTPLGQLVKTHTRTGRVWVLVRERKDSERFVWVEEKDTPRPKDLAMRAN